MRIYQPLPLQQVRHYWKQAVDGFQPLPWNTPPIIELKGIGTYDIRAVIVLTVADVVYHLASYSEFYRLMDRDGFLKYVHPNGKEEIVLKLFGTYINPTLELQPKNLLIFPSRNR